MEVDLYIRTYPRSGTHLVSSILHFYYGFVMPEEYSTYVKPLIGEGDLQMFTYHWEPKSPFEVYQLRNPIDCISSQFYRYGSTERGEVLNEKRNQYLNTLPKNEIPQEFLGHPPYHSLWNEVGRYNHMINSIKPDDCVLYYEDLLNNPEEYFNTLDYYLKHKYNLTKLTPKKSFQEILDFTAEYYDKSATMLFNSTNPIHSSLKVLKEQWKPVINGYLDTSNPYIQRYLK